MKKLLILLFSISLAVLLTACNDDSDSAAEEEEKETTEQAEVEFSEEERVDEDATVLKVNDVEIKGDKYNQLYTQIKTIMHQSGQAVDDLDLIREQVISYLTEQELLIQDAQNKGIEVTEEEINSEIEKMKAEGEEAYNTMLEQYDLTEEDVKEMLQEELLTFKYMEQEFATEVTEEEIEEYYNELKEENEEIADLAEVKEQIQFILQNQKQAQQVQERVAELKENAEIETLI